MKKLKVEDMTDEELKYAYNREIMEYQIKRTRRAERNRKFMKMYYIIVLIVVSPMLLLFLAMFISPFFSMIAG